MEGILGEVISFCFAGDEFAPPRGTSGLLMELQGPEHAIIVREERDAPPRVTVHAWPSWLTRGGARIV